MNLVLSLPRAVGLVPERYQGFNRDLSVVRPPEDEIVGNFQSTTKQLS